MLPLLAGGRDGFFVICAVAGVGTSMRCRTAFLADWGLVQQMQVEESGTAGRRPQPIKIMGHLENLSRAGYPSLNLTDTIYHYQGNRNKEFANDVLIPVTKLIANHRRMCQCGD